MSDFLVIGDVMMDHIIRITDSTIVNSIDERAHTVTLPYPSKVQLELPADNLGGGNAYTAAKVLRKLGLETSIYTVVGKDKEGDDLLADLKAQGIDCSLTTVDESSATNNSYVLTIGSDRVLFSHHHTRQYHLPSMPDVKFVYLTSLGEDDTKMFSQLVELRKQHEFFLIFSPGTLQVREDFSEVRQIMGITDLLIVNKQEAKDLSRLQSESNEHLLRGLKQFGPKQVVITRSDHGSIAFDGTNFTKVGALKVQAIETTGAGDTYSATLSAALAKGKDLRTAMELSALQAAKVLSEDGLASMLEWEALLQQHSQKASTLVYEEPVTTDPIAPKEHLQNGS